MTTPTTRPASAADLTSGVQDKAGKPVTSSPRLLTDRMVKQTKPDPIRRLDIRDTGVTGLLLRITPNGVRTFALQTRGFDGKQFKMTLGRYPEVGLVEARDLAKAALLDIARGVDPREKRRAARAAADADALTLRTLLDEVEPVFAPSRSTWRSGSRPDRQKVEARASIENVFEALLDVPLSSLTLGDLAVAVSHYVPKRPLRGKSTANGAASRARNYLRSVFNWASGRKPFDAQGAGRNPRLDLPELAEVSDPSVHDQTIEGRRTRVLKGWELNRLLPLLVYPAPTDLRERLDPDEDFLAIATRFLVLTMSRREEVAEACWKDVDFSARTWTKFVKDRPPAGSIAPFARRLVTVPLSKASVELLLALPGAEKRASEDFIFATSTGGRLRNWGRAKDEFQEVSKTADWTYHDLRRTASTLLRQLGASPVVIDRLLCHKDPLASQNVSKAAASYMVDELVLEDGPDPEREAIELLARSLLAIEAKPASSLPAACDLRKPLRGEERIGMPAVETPKPRARSPWALAAGS